MPLIVFNTQIFHFPAATGTKCSHFAEHCSSLAYLLEYLIVGSVVCMLEGYVHVRWACLFLLHVCVQN